MLPNVASISTMFASFNYWISKGDLNTLPW